MSRYDRFRRRIAPVALLIAIALIARDSCEKEERTNTTVELRFGADRPRVRALDVRVMVRGAEIATYHRAALPGSTIGPCRFPLSTPEQEGELEIDVDLGDGHHRLTRRFHAVEGSTLQITIPDQPPR